MPDPAEPFIVGNKPRSASCRLSNNSYIMKKILLMAREGATAADFFPCLFINKKYHLTAYHILYCVLVLTNGTLPRFIVCAAQRRDPIPYPVLSLTVRLKVVVPCPQCVTGIDPSPIEGYLEALAAIVSQYMESLDSFSFFIDDRELETGNALFRTMGASFHAPALGELLDAIPTDCRNLEIDTAGLEVYQGEYHLCPNIARLLAKLQYLRIRVGRICIGFLEVEFQVTAHGPHLVSLVVNLESKNEDRLITQLCGAGSDWESVSEFIGALRSDILLGGHVPRIRQLEVYCHDFPSGTLVRRLLRFDILNPQFDGWPTEYFSSSDLSLGASEPLLCTRFRSGHILARHSDTRDITEHAWSSTIEGARMPARRSYVHLQMMDIMAAYDLKQIRKKPRVITKLPVIIAELPTVTVPVHLMSN